MGTMTAPAPTTPSRMGANSGQLGSTTATLSPTPIPREPRPLQNFLQNTVSLMKIYVYLTFSASLLGDICELCEGESPSRCPADHGLLVWPLLAVGQAPVGQVLGRETHIGEGGGNSDSRGTWTKRLDQEEGKQPVWRMKQMTTKTLS